MFRRWDPLAYGVLGEWGEYAALRVLRADVNGQDGLTAERHWSASGDKADTVQLLIRHGVDVTARDDTRSTPLHLASSKGSAESVDILIRHRSDVNAKGCEPVVTAAPSDIIPSQIGRHDDRTPAT